MQVPQGSGVCAALCIRRTLCRHVTIGTPMVIFLLFDCLLTVFDEWYTVYQSSKTLKTIGVQIVTGLPRLYQQCTNGVPIAKNSQNSTKMTTGVPVVTCLPRLYQPCRPTNSVPKTVKRHSNQQKWPLVYLYQPSQFYQDCTNSVTILYQSSTRT